MSQPAGEQPIVRISPFSIAGRDIGRGKNRRPTATHYTVHGVDAEGNERVYVEHASEADHEAWWASGPRWCEAQGAIIRRLLDKPTTRDTLPTGSELRLFRGHDRVRALKKIEVAALRRLRHMLEIEAAVPPLERWLRAPPARPTPLELGGGDMEVNTPLGHIQLDLILVTHQR